jgi:hypothetical protein
VTRFRSRAGIRPMTSWLVVSGEQSPSAWLRAGRMTPLLAERHSGRPDAHTSRCSAAPASELSGGCEGVTRAPTPMLLDQEQPFCRCPNTAGFGPGALALSRSRWLALAVIPPGVELHRLDLEATCGPHPICLCAVRLMVCPPGARDGAAPCWPRRCGSAGRSAGGGRARPDRLCRPSVLRRRVPRRPA